VGNLDQQRGKWSPSRCRILWVPRMSSGYLDQDFPGMAREDETGPWPSRSSTSPSPGSSSWCASADVTATSWRSRSSCSATRLPCSVVKSCDRHRGPRIELCSPGCADCSIDVVEESSSCNQRPCFGGTGTWSGGNGPMPTVWVPRMSSGYLDQGLPRMAGELETGPWPSRSSTSHSPTSSS